MHSPASIKRLIEDFYIENSSRPDALQALGDFGREENNREHLAEAVPILSKLVQQILTNNSLSDVNVQNELALCFRAIGNMCYEHDANRKAFQDQGIIPTMVALLHKYVGVVTEFPVVKNLLGALTNLASDNEILQTEIISNGGIDSLVEVVASESSAHDTKIFAIRTLINLVENGVAHNALLAQPNTLNSLISAMGEGEDILARVVEALKGLVKNEDIQKRLLEANILVLLHNTTRSLIEKLSVSHIVESEDEEGEETAAEISSDLLVELANIESIRPHFWNKDIAIEILETASNIGEQSSGELLKVQRNLARCFGLLALQDDCIGYILKNFPLVLKLVNTRDASVKLSGLTVVANVARTDAHCKELISSGCCDLVVTIINENQNDQRLVHTGLAVLRNLSISDTNKVAIASKGGILVATNSLKISSLLIQYEAIGVLKCLLSGQIPKDHVTVFTELGGVQSLVQIATAQVSGTEERPDPRVMYESCRLLCRLCDYENVLELVGVDAVPIFMTLVTSKFGLLQCEGAQAVCKLVFQGKYLAETAQVLTTFIQPLAIKLSNNDPHSLMGAVFILRTLTVLVDKGYKEVVNRDAAEVIKAWANNNANMIKSEEVGLLLSKLV